MYGSEKMEVEAGYSGGGGGGGLWLDGLLEGYESPGVRTVCRISIIIYLIFAAWSIIAPFILIKKYGWGPQYAVLGGGILGVTFFTVFLIKTYKSSNLDPKFKKATVGLILVNIVLCIASTWGFHEVLIFPPEPTPVPTAFPTAFPTAEPAPTTPEPPTPPPTTPPPRE